MTAAAQHEEAASGTLELGLSVLEFLVSPGLRIGSFPKRAR